MEASLSISPGMPNALARLICRLVVRFQLLRLWKLDGIDELIVAAEQE